MIAAYAVAVKVRLVMLPRMEKPPSVVGCGCATAGDAGRVNLEKNRRFKIEIGWHQA